MAQIKLLSILGLFLQFSLVQLQLKGIHDQDRRVKGTFGSASEIQPVSVAEPNLGALLGNLGITNLGGNPLTASGLLPGLVAGRSLSHNQSPASLQHLGDLSGICGPNSDQLTNLLVYQYLQGTLPAAQNQNAAAHAAVAQAAVAQAAVAGNPQLRALLNQQQPKRKPISTTITSISSTVTTRVVTLEASTKFSTATTSYVTTITSLASSVIPIIFRGSKLITTITDRLTEVLTATEFYTSSTVLVPSIIQTLPVRITVTQTSTIGLDGLFTLDKVTPGATKVIEQPISTKSINFDTKGLDIDLSTLDLSSFSSDGKENAEMLNALSALLQQYSDEPAEQKNSFPRSRFETGHFGTSRFHGKTKEEPKFNVIRGFTLSDREPPKQKSSGGGGGTASSNSRYSKFRKKNTVDNNSLASTEPDRESERFSASTSRRTVASADTRRRSSSSRFSSRGERERKRTPASNTRDDATLSARSISGRSGRQIERRNQRRVGRTARGRRRGNFDSINPAYYHNEISPTFRTTILTMHISGNKPGEIITTQRVVTLRNFGTARFRRHIKHHGATPSKPKEQITSTEAPAAPDSKDVIELLQGLDRPKVAEMLHSLHDWADYYLKEVLDEQRIMEYSHDYSDIETNEITSLLSSQSQDVPMYATQDATLELASLPEVITFEPKVSTAVPGMCPKLSVVTETVYKTLYKTKTEKS